MLESEWRDISNAPRDGSWVLLFCDFHDGGKEMRVARWVADHRPATRREKPYGPFVWATQDGPPNLGTIAERVPTHWMPLPAPPDSILNEQPKE